MVLEGLELVCVCAEDGAGGAGVGVCVCRGWSWRGWSVVDLVVSHMSRALHNAPQELVLSLHGEGREVFAADGREMRVEVNYHNAVGESSRASLLLLRLADLECQDECGDGLLTGNEGCDDGNRVVYIYMYIY
jgi:hypothetical protein